MRQRALIAREPGFLSSETSAISGAERGDMEDFETVKTRLKRVNVTAPAYGNAHGVISLDGNDSVIELTGEIPYSAAEPPGWFNLRLEDANGRAIHIHNALRTSMSFPQDREMRSATIFPNIVVDNADGLDRDARCRSIRFGLEGWEACFAYNYFETLDVYGPLPEELRSRLEAARYEFMREEHFDPRQIYVANHFGTIAAFEANDRQYSIYAAIRQRFGSRDRLEAKLELTGCIEFAEPTDLEVAIDACWDWRRFFNQMAMSEMPFTGMAVAASPEPQSPTGNLYLPNDRREALRASRHQTDAYHMPLNQWEDREQLCEAMRRWLACDIERRFFRAALDRVTARPGHVAIEDAVALCAGIDTIADLSAREALPRPVLEAMCEAAVEAAAAAHVEVDPVRVRGLLGSLQNDDLRRKLRRMAAIAAPEAEPEAIEGWINVVIPLRLFGAHGRTPALEQDHIAGPAVDGLAGLCARFDLQSAGVPDRAGERARSMPRLKWDEALLSLMVYRRMGTNETGAEPMGDR